MQFSERKAIANVRIGKTAMLLRYVDNTFDENLISTIGVDFKVKRAEVSGKRLKIQIVCLIVNLNFN